VDPPKVTAATSEMPANTRAPPAAKVRPSISPKWERQPKRADFSVYNFAGRRSASGAAGLMNRSTC